MLDNVGSLQQAELIALEALEHHSNQSSVHFNYANVLGKMKRFLDSEHHFHMAITLEPDKANHHLNLGVLYHQWKRYDLAYSQYETALRIEPNSESARANIDMLLKTFNKSDLTS